MSPALRISFPTYAAYSEFNRKLQIVKANLGAQADADAVVALVHAAYARITSGAQS